MDYELVKKLKDAGFPQPGDKYLVAGQMPGTYSADTGDMVYIPTLSELIEACGEGFTMLIKPTNYTNPENLWYAGIDDADQEGYPNVSSDYPSGEGKTPEEAVAKLWLALNKV